MKDNTVRIAVISDTHDLLRPEVIRQIGDSDAVIHAGDFSSRKVLEQIKASMKDPEQFYYVRGNNDHEWAEELPEMRSFEIGGIRFHLIHNYKKLPKEPVPADIIIFGHSHRYLAEEKGDCLWLNPGSCGKRRFHQEISMAVLEIRNGSYHVRKTVIELPVQKQEIREEDRLFLIREIYKRMDRGQKIGQMASALKAEPELVEEICRIRSTHPGASPEDILNKMEVNRTIMINDREP